jgi:membrane protease YdiL (CAAX protease family)
MNDEASTQPADAPPPPRKPRDLATEIFLSADGLRSGWRLLIYAALVFGIYPAASLIVWAVLKPTHGSFTYTNQLGFELVGCASVLGAAFLMSKIERRPAGAYGLPIRSALGKDFWWGCIFGFCEMSALIGLISVFGGYSLGARALSGMEIAKWGFLWLGFFLLVALFEEFLFRGYALYTLADGVGFWPAAILLALCFGAVHKQNDGENWIGVFGVFVVGLFWCFTVRRTGALWFAVGMHVSFDFAETFLYSVPDSGAVLPGHLTNATLHGAAWLTGGSVGPEASVFDFIILAIFFYLFHLIYPASKSKTAQDEIELR